MVDHHNVNVNGNYNVAINSQGANVNVNRYERAKKAELLARQLVDKFKDEGSFRFFCKVAHKLSESRVWENYEAAIKGSNPLKGTPIGLFIFLCKKDIGD